MLQSFFFFCKRKQVFCCCFLTTTKNGVTPSIHLCYHLVLCHPKKVPLGRGRNCCRPVCSPAGVSRVQYLITEQKNSWVCLFHSFKNKHHKYHKNKLHNQSNDKKIKCYLETFCIQLIIMKNTPFCKYLYISGFSSGPFNQDKAQGLGTAALHYCLLVVCLLCTHRKL